MEAVYYKEGVYVVIDSSIDNDTCVYNYSKKNNVVLWGGRIRIKRDHSNGAYATLDIDGIPIGRLYHFAHSDSSFSLAIEKGLSLSTVASHLNAIEANGIDAFLENYKQSINSLYGELKELSIKTEMQLSSEQDESKITILLAELKRIRNVILSILAIIFSLQTNMTAGLENEKVMSVCQSIMDSLM